jgi:hypothetical protein
MYFAGIFEGWIFYLQEKQIQIYFNFLHPSSHLSLFQGLREPAQFLFSLELPSGAE